MTPLLATRDLWRSHRHGDILVHACRAIDLELHPGTFTVLHGPSGSGKTSLINLLCGWERPDRGTITWRGTPTDPATLPWDDLAIVPQRLGLYEELTISENLTLPTRVGTPPPPVDGLLERLDLTAVARHHPGEVSHGQRQRAALGRALIAAPALLLADEPTSAQDEEHAREVLALLRDQAVDGGTVLVASHDPLTHDYATHTLPMRDGSIS